MVKLILTAGQFAQCLALNETPVIVGHYQAKGGVQWQIICALDFV